MQWSTPWLAQLLPSYILSIPSQALVRERVNWARCYVIDDFMLACVSEEVINGQYSLATTSAAESCPFSPLPVPVHVSGWKKSLIIEKPLNHPYHHLSRTSVLLAILLLGFGPPSQLISVHQVSWYQIKGNFLNLMFFPPNLLPSFCKQVDH